MPARHTTVTKSLPVITPGKLNQHHLQQALSRAGNHRGRDNDKERSETLAE